MNEINKVSSQYIKQFAFPKNISLEKQKNLEPYEKNQKNLEEKIKKHNDKHFISIGDIKYKKLPEDGKYHYVFDKGKFIKAVNMGIVIEKDNKTYIIYPRLLSVIDDIQGNPRNSFHEGAKLGLFSAILQLAANFLLNIGPIGFSLIGSIPSILKIIDYKSKKEKQVEKFLNSIGVKEEAKKIIKKTVTQELIKSKTTSELVQYAMPQLVNIGLYLVFSSIMGPIGKILAFALSPVIIGYHSIMMDSLKYHIKEIHEMFGIKKPIEEYTN